MKGIPGVIAAVAVFGLIGSAKAAEAVGRIAVVDPTQRAILLEDGNTYAVHPAVDLAALQRGSSVKVTYENQGGQRVIIDVKSAE